MVYKALITFRASRRRREMYIGHARLCACVSVCACLSLAAFPHYCTDPDVGLIWGGMVGVSPSLCTVGQICNRYTSFVPITTQCEREMSASVCIHSVPDFVCE